MLTDYTGVIFDYRLKKFSKKEDQYFGRIPFKRFLKEMKPDKLLAFYQPENPDFIKCAALYFEKRDNTIAFKTLDDEYVYASYVKFSETSIAYLTGKYGEITEKEGLCDRLYKNRKNYLNSLPVNEPSIDPIPVVKKKVYEPEISKKEYTSILDIPFDDAITNISLFPYIEYHYSHRKHTFDKKGEVHPFVFFKNGIYKVVYLNVFYCKKCNMYFDVKQSFLAQLKSLDIKPEDMIVSYKDEKGKTISFGDNKKFNEHSKLNLLGYRVGRGGLPLSKRHDILRFALKSGYMELYEIKNHIDFLIDYNGKRDNMDKAISDWKSDLEFINKI